jgi:hypothetical protein
VPFVMVPVPEELEPRVRRYLIWRVTSEESGRWSEESVAAVYDDVDETSRTLLTRVARGVMDGEPVTVVGAALAARTSTREIYGIVMELVQRIQVRGGPAFPIVLLDAPEGAGDDQRVISMPHEGARVALAIAERG